MPYGTNPAFCNASCPSCAGEPQERQEKLTVAHLERLKGASRGAAAAQFDTAFRCQTCGTIYSFRNGVGFPLVKADAFTVPAPVLATFLEPCRVIAGPGPTFPILQLVF